MESFCAHRRALSIGGLQFRQWPNTGAAARHLANLINAPNTSVTAMGGAAGFNTGLWQVTTNADTGLLIRHKLICDPIGHKVRISVPSQTASPAYASLMTLPGAIVVPVAKVYSEPARLVHNPLQHYPFLLLVEFPMQAHYARLTSFIDALWTVSTERAGVPA